MCLNVHFLKQTQWANVNNSLLQAKEEKQIVSNPILLVKKSSKLVRGKTPNFGSTCPTNLRISVNN